MRSVGELGKMEREWAVGQTSRWARGREWGRRKRREGVGEGKWRKPGFGELKLNCDAAWRKNIGEGGVGWVLRDFAGIPILAGGIGGVLGMPLWQRLWRLDRAWR